jgi:hypothetical protein
MQLDFVVKLRGLLFADKKLCFAKKEIQIAAKVRISTNQFF